MQLAEWLSDGRSTFRKVDSALPVWETKAPALLRPGALKGVERDKTEFLSEVVKRFQPLFLTYSEDFFRSDGIVGEWSSSRSVGGTDQRDGARVALPQMDPQRVAVRHPACRRREHQFLFLGNRSFSLRGSTTVAEGFNDLWLYTGMLPNAAMRSEGLVHEMGHEWLVNDQWLIANPPPGKRPGGHCDEATGAARFIYNHSGLLCLMHSSLYGSTSNPGVADGIVGFHFISINGHDDSEYLRIRQRVDPVPQNENQGRVAN